jgi:hypothetical protein
MGGFIKTGSEGNAVKTPNTKHQTPNTKPTVPGRRAAFGVWELVFLWCLVFGVWCFLP